ncbi:acyl-CoA dehydrogenase family protein [Paraburkholderia aromaticivorans]|uniref:acyl-CoA dehydrogenase family protein n=1 Tax=Paraburkholderia aromaticivorans TaxID=2026199 RepID=UPI00145623CF|nr:acyl-CoA dehydrogenase family protein [Paraburkholderia aromaticivorans]
MTVDNDELNMIRESARALASRFDLDYWREHDTEGKYPTDFIQAFADGGWLGSMIPEEYGGMGLGMTAAATMLQEAAYFGGSNGASAIHFYIFPPGPVIRHASEELKRKYLPDIASGKSLMCFGVTEPTAGVDTSRITTRAERKDGRWVINGQKVWITNAQRADRILLLARTSPRNDERPYDGMTLFFTRMDRKAITATPIEKLARNAIDTNELFIENLEVGDDEVVGEVGKGFKYLLDGLNPERIVVAWEQIGLGRRALDLAVNYANTRVVFNRPIGKNQAIAHPLADSWMRLQSSQMMAEHAARLYDEHKPCGPEANAAKFLATEAAFEVCDRAMQTHGGFCYAKEYHIERLWREARLLKIAPVSQEMVLNYVSEKVLGLPKSY